MFSTDRSFFLCLLQQLMRERQQMASRPFASVAVALELGADQEELLQVSVTHTHTYTHISCIHTQGEAKYCDGKAHSGASEGCECLFARLMQRLCWSCCCCSAQEAPQVHPELVVFDRTKTKRQFLFACEFANVVEEGWSFGVEDG